jgi:antibiotic biosynthesis monooxygenase (ABM) superfamily enzyme
MNVVFIYVSQRSVICVGLHAYVDYIVLSTFVSSTIEESRVLTSYPNSYSVLLKILFSVALLQYYFLPQSEILCKYVICI